MIRILLLCPRWDKKHIPGGIPTCIQQQADFLNETKEVHAEIECVRTSCNPFNYLSAWARYGAKFDVAAKYDIVHFQWGYLPLVGLPFKKPVVVTLRGGDVFENEGEKVELRGRDRIAGFATTYCAWRAQRVIAVSRHLGLKLGGLPFEVIPDGVDFSRFHSVDLRLARQTLGLPLEGKIVLFGSAAGNSVKNYKLAKTVCGLTFEDPILLTLDGVLHSQVAVYMGACDVLLLTSFREGSPNIVKEALACGLPVLSVNVGDVAEQLSSVVGCRVVNSYDPSTLARELNAMLDARHRVSAPLSELDQRLITKKLIRVYRDVLSGVD